MRTLGKDHTVIFSSHLLAEVQQLCSRVLILHHGRLIKDQEMGESTDELLYLRVSVMADEKKLLPALKSLPCIRRVKVLPAAEPGCTEAELECITS